MGFYGKKYHQQRVETRFSTTEGIALEKGYGEETLLQNGEKGGREAKTIFFATVTQEKGGTFTSSRIGEGCSTRSSL